MEGICFLVLMIMGKLKELRNQNFRNVFNTASYMVLVSLYLKKEMFLKPLYQYLKICQLKVLLKVEVKYPEELMFRMILKPIGMILKKGKVIPKKLKVILKESETG